MMVEETSPERPGDVQEVAGTRTRPQDRLDSRIRCGRHRYVDHQRVRPARGVAARDGEIELLGHGEHPRVEFFRSGERQRVRESDRHGRRDRTHGHGRAITETARDRLPTDGE
jgi:hypothetical protein